MKKIRKKPPIKKKKLPDVMHTLDTFARLFGDISLRLVAMEEIIMEHLPELTPQKLTLRIARVQDKRDGLVATGTVDLRDRVRLRIQAQQDVPTGALKPGEVVYGPQKNLLIPFIGAGQVLDAGLESQIFGMKVEETREIDFADPRQEGDATMKVRVTIDTIARVPEIKAVEQEGTQDGY